MRPQPLTQARPHLWPFRTEQQRAEYEALRRRGYELLRQAHELFMAAMKERGK